MQKIRDLVERIDGAQARMNSKQSIIVTDRRATNMFRAQVAMPAHDMTAAHALGNQKPALYTIDLSDEPRGKAKTRIEQNTSVE